jgi:hypothetical protein
MQVETIAEVRPKGYAGPVPPRLEHAIAPAAGTVKAVDFGAGEQMAEGTELIAFEPAAKAI